MHDFPSIALVCIIYAAFQFYSLISFTGKNRVLASLPLAGVIGVIGYTAYTIAQGAHQVPLILVVTVPVAILYLAILIGSFILTRRYTNRKQKYGG